MKKIILNLLALTLMISGNIFASESTREDPLDYLCLNRIENKIYFNSDQIIISERGIFVLVEDVDGNIFHLSVSALNYDSTGIFVLEDNVDMARDGFCRCNARICTRCGGCTERSIRRCGAKKCRCGG